MAGLHFVGVLATPAVGVITGSDDSTVRRMLFVGGGDGVARFTGSAEVGTHAAGTHVRALAVVPENVTGEA